MKFSEQWLREWVDPPISTTQLVEQLTMAGLEVDSVEPVAAQFSGVVVGEVLSVEPHPDADKLRICRVSVGADELLQIVCGAANVRAGMYVPVALVGASLPGGIVITKAKLRGVESNGMLCSAKELGIADDPGGLLELPASTTPGVDIRIVLKMDDHSLEIDLTPNRGDCLGLAGVARELGVLNRCDVIAPAIEAVAPHLPDTFPIDVQATDACPRYLGRVIHGLSTTALTPLWMRERLRRSGLRSLGPLIDVTNYVLLELGQPMHAFDLAKLRGGICVRWARADEKIALLDGKEIELDIHTLVIADDAHALALAGIMGGLDSAVSSDTDSVFLECAFFVPDAVAGRARRYGLQTDSAYRFERGVDPDLQRRAMERATSLLLEIAGGRAGPVGECVTDSALPTRSDIELRRARIRRLLGMELADAEIQDVLTRLGMKVTSHALGWRVTPPSFRFDIVIEADLIEELARVHGYNNLPSNCSQAGLVLSPQSETTLNTERVRQLFVDRGYQEVVTYSFIDPVLQQHLDPDRSPIKLTNPISSELSVMRTQLWPGLVKTLIHNRNRQQSGAKYFEIGLNYILQDKEIVQEKYFACLISGPVFPEQWGLPQRAADFFDLKADVEALLDQVLDSDLYQFRPEAHPALHPGQSASVVFEGHTFGWIGVLHPDVERQLELPGQTLLFELNLSRLPVRALPYFNELSKYPAIRRDLSIVVADAIAADTVIACIRNAACPLLQEVRLFDVYQGPSVESGRRSIAFGLILQDSSRTLRDEEVDAVITLVMARLNQELNANLRD